MKPTICLNMIVRDEAAIIAETLENLLSVVPISHWVIHDTGSLDDTAAIIERTMLRRGIPGRLVHRKWENFGKNRQMALEDASGTADFVLFFDADCRIEGVWPDLDLGVDSYSIMSERASSIYPVKHVVRNDGRFRWRGVVHEGLYFSGPGSEQTRRIEGVTVKNQSIGARSRDPLTYCRDARMLVDAVENIAPEDQDLLPRYTFYAANSWRDAKCHNEAAKWYRKRIALGGWADEVYMSHLNLGMELMLDGDVDGARAAWLAGVEVCPDRAECLYKLAQVEREQSRYNVALVYAKAAMDIPMPKPGRLFLWADVYRFWAAFEYLWSLRHLGRQAEGEAARAAMRAAGAPPHLFEIVK